MPLSSKERNGDRGGQKDDTRQPEDGNMVDSWAYS